MLEKLGIDIQTSIDKLHFQVRLCMAVGDILAVAELCKHTGHTSYPGCRICCIIGEKTPRRRGLYFCNIIEDVYKEYPVRTVHDYKTVAKVSTSIDDYIY